MSVPGWSYHVPELEPVDKHSFVATMQDGTKQTVRVTGHRLYVRKDKHAEVTADGLIALPESHQENTNVCTVIAIGDEVGKPRDPDKERTHMGGRQVAARLVNPIRLGDKVLCPGSHQWAITRSPLTYFDYFVDEDVIEGVVDMEN